MMLVEKYAILHQHDGKCLQVDHLGMFMLQEMMK